MRGWSIGMKPRVWGAGRLTLEPGHVPVIRIVDLSPYAEAGWTVGWWSVLVVVVVRVELSEEERLKSRKERENCTHQQPEAHASACKAPSH
jgi:hypothetical protein